LPEDMLVINKDPDGKYADYYKNAISNAGYKYEYVNMKTEAGLS
jgi:hypothetical protein